MQPQREKCKRWQRKRRCNVEWSEHSSDADSNPAVEIPVAGGHACCHSDSAGPPTHCAVSAVHLSCCTRSTSHLWTFTGSFITDSALLPRKKLWQGSDTKAHTPKIQQGCSTKTKTCFIMINFWHSKSAGNAFNRLGQRTGTIPKVSHHKVWNSHPGLK